MYDREITKNDIYYYSLSYNVRKSKKIILFLKTIKKVKLPK